MAVKLNVPRLRVIMESGQVHEVQTRNSDLVAFDRERGRHRDWPSMQDGPVMWQNFVAWQACSRLGLEHMTLAEFERQAIEVSVIQDGGDDDDVDPTPPAAELE